MTTSAYIALVEPVLTLAELAAENVRIIAKNGLALAPRVDQILSFEHPIEVFAEKHPANDNEPQDEAAPANDPQPAVALSPIAALVEFMKILRNAPGAPRVASEMANDWLKRSAQPGAEYSGRQIVSQMKVIWPKIFQLISRQAAVILSPRSGRGQMRSMYNDVPAPKTLQIPSRQLKEKLDADRPRQQPKNSFAA